MLLLERVLEAASDRVCCRASLSERCALFRRSDGTYPNTLLIEFMAQSVGVYAGIRDNATVTGPRVGFLLGSRKIAFSKETLFEGDVYDIDVRCSFFGEDSLPSQFDCHVYENGKEVASATLTVYRPQNLQQFISETTND